MAQINRIQRERLAYLMQLEIDCNGLLAPAERQELLTLQRLGGIAPDAPDTPQRSRASSRQRVLQTLEVRWPRQPISGRQAVLELLKLRGEWHLSPRQRQLQRIRQRWTT